MNKIHIAFGFHVNCYHSYRGDTNDNLGFGSDIRIIRKIIKVLNQFNENGIPVKGTWDTENFFSLEEILPKYAPDIIDGIKERTEKYGDENIIMGYNNGALSAMNEAEFTASIEKAVTNENGSGLQDIFGKCEKIVRPQEVMFTPSQVSLYNKLGVKALCLYYSAIPFDAFRTIVPRLSDEEAFNPLTYTYNGESMIILPTYSNADVMDAGCLRSWVKELHKKQESGEIKNDLFIFINMDADAILWETIELPLITGKIANTDGIHGLVKEVCDLPFVEFNTPGGYLKNHAPIGKIDFTQDTADGNFTGYASWSEKPFNRLIWTRLERARALALLSESDEKSPSFDDRIKLLSTTHFGLATPVLNISREKKALELSEKMTESEISSLEKAKKLTVLNTSGSNFVSVQLKKNGSFDASQISISSKGLKDFAAVDISDESIFLMMLFEKAEKSYSLNVKLSDKKKTAEPNNLILKTASTEIKFSVHGRIYSVTENGREIGNENFLKSYLTYNGVKYDFGTGEIKDIACGGSAKALKVSGKIDLPEQIHQGKYEYIFFTVPFSDAIFVKTTVNYPLTKEDYSISTENSSLGRFTDIKWEEAVPFQLTPLLHKDCRVIKRNFMDDISSFKTSSFFECDKENKKLDSFNHQLTAGMVGLSDNKCGIIAANSRQVLCSMAHCPMRIDENGITHMNLFGTYFGSQRHHWSRTNGSVLNAYNIVTPQAKSIAPSYNGNSETALIGLYAFDGEMPNENTVAEIKAFSDGAVIKPCDEQILGMFNSDNVIIHDAAENNIDESKLKSPVAIGHAGFKYLTLGSKAIFNIVKHQIKSK